MWVYQRSFLDASSSCSHENSLSPLVSTSISTFKLPNSPARFRQFRWIDWNCMFDRKNWKVENRDTMLYLVAQLECPSRTQGFWWEFAWYFSQILSLSGAACLCQFDNACLPRLLHLKCLVRITLPWRQSTPTLLTVSSQPLWNVVWKHYQGFVSLRVPMRRRTQQVELWWAI